MSNQIDKIKKQIYKETRSVFENLQQAESYDLIELLFKVISYPINDSSMNLDGLEARMLNAFSKILLDDVSNEDRDTFFADFAKVEPLFRKLLLLVNPIEYEEIRKNNQGLSVLISKLSLNPKNLNLDSLDLKKLAGDPGFIDHYAKVYRVKNLESHTIKEWSKKQFGEYVESFLVVYLHSISRHKSLLLKLENTTTEIIEPSFNQYCDLIIQSFKERANRFIPLSSKENITFSASYVTEYKLPAENDDEMIGREGLVETLRHSAVPEKRMMLWGDAGLGKSTTLEFLSYKDANKRKSNTLLNIPVYVPLGLLTDATITLEQYIFKKLGIETTLGKYLLTKGKINLFLDGLNEIPKDSTNSLITFRYKEIESLLNEYKNTFIIITNRPEQINRFKEMPVFFIQKMNEKQIKDFVKKYSDGNKAVEDKINKAIDADERLKRIIQSPLMLSRLIEIVKTEGEIPSNEGMIIDRFIDSLYRREMIDKKDGRFNSKQIHKLLAYLASYSLEEKGTNAAMTENEVSNAFIRCRKEYGFEIDIDYVIEICCQLNLLERSEGKLVFAHQSYQDYFFTEYERMVLGL